MPNRRFHFPKLTEQQLRLFSTVNRALDSATEFGIETASRERLLMLTGELIGALRALKEMICEKGSR